MSDSEIEEQHINMGLEQLRIGNPRGATEQFNCALEIDPDNAFTHSWLAIALHDSGKLELAQKEAEQAIKLEPEMAFAYYAAGVVASSQQKYPTAEEYLKKAIALDCDTGFFFEALANVFSLTEQKEKVLDTLNEGLKVDPENPDILSAIGTHHFEEGNLTEAEKYGEEALKIDPESQSGNILLGNIFLEKDKIDEAREHTLLALKNYSEDPKALYLFCAIKTRLSPIWGMWWRYYTWLRRCGQVKAYSMLIILFIACRYTDRFLVHSENFLIDNIGSVFWLTICLHSWLGIIYFENLLEKEIATVELKKDF